MIAQLLLGKGKMKKWSSWKRRECMNRSNRSKTILLWSLASAKQSMINWVPSIKMLLL